ncbi:g11382 [Coccomyxa elongata]
MTKEPRVGVGVLIFRDGHVLVGRRLGAHGKGEFALPGGHLEFGESWEDCAKREVEEETGLQLSNLRFETAVNSVFGDTAHYVTIFMRGEADQVAEAKVLEPDKCESWIWVPWLSIPQPVFLPLQLLQESGYHPFRHALQDGANQQGS